MFLISDANFVGYNLAELLLAENCVVFVYSNQPDQWVKALYPLKDNEFLKVFSLTAAYPEICDYLFFMSGFSATPSLAGLALATALAKKFAPKFFVLLPFVQASLSEEIVKSVKERVLEKDFPVQIVYLGEVFGPRMETAMPWPTARLISKAISGRTLVIPVTDEEIYPIFVGDAVRQVVKAAFSYGFDKNEVVIADRTLNEKHLKDTLVWFSKNWKTQIHPEVEMPVQSTKKDFVISIRVPEFKIPKLPKIGLKKLSPIAVAVAVVITLISSPYVALGASGVLLKRAYDNFTQGKTTRVGFYLNTSGKLADMSLEGMRALSSVPVLGKWLGFGFDDAILVQQAAHSGQRAIKVTALASEIVSGIFDDEPYDVEALSESLNLELEALYQQTSFLESEAKGRFPELKTLRFYAANSLGLVRNLPDLLGGQATKTYLILFQNNMELRPTGGFIGSFALATFTKGKLLDLAVMDVYSADGQLKGHVEPPLPIKYYLGEANWFLRDANWDPDFPTAAAQIEWFLDKEIDRSVDGVVAVDLEVAKSVLEQIGSVHVADFNQTIDAKNLYERVQYEVEEDFFPGSRKKANLLSALASAMLTQISQLNETNYVALAKKMVTNLRQRHIQVFLHNKDAANAISNLGWDGEISVADCAGNCATSVFGAVEANVGVNKANYFTERQMVLTSKVADKKIINSLVVDIKNNSPASLGLAGKYKSYIRVVLPGNVEIDDVTIDSIDGRQTKKPEVFEKSGRAEAGVVIEVPSGQRSKILFSWTDKANLDFTRPGEYRVFWRKQAGTISDPVSVNVSLPLSVEPKGDLVYNTSLAEDLVKSFFW